MTDSNSTTDSAQSLGGQARKTKLSPERRAEIAREAAKKRWGTKKTAAATPAKTKTPASKTRGKVSRPMKKTKKRRPAMSNSAAWRQFNNALITAEKKLIEAQADRADAWARYCQLSNEIPNLENTVNALRALQNTATLAPVKQPNSPYDLASILAGQQPMPTQFVSIPAAPPAYTPPPQPAIPPMPILPPAIPISGYVPPSMAEAAKAAEASGSPEPTPELVVMHAPVPQSRAHGVAMGAVPALEQNDDEDQFLRGPMASSTGWH